MQGTQEMQVRYLGWEDPLEEGMATLSSIRAWRTPRTEEPDGLQSMGLQRVKHNWSDWAHSNFYTVTLTLNYSKEDNSAIYFF